MKRGCVVGTCRPNPLPATALRCSPQRSVLERFGLGDTNMRTLLPRDRHFHPDAVLRARADGCIQKRHATPSVANGREVQGRSRCRLGKAPVEARQCFEVAFRRTCRQPRRTPRGLRAIGFRTFRYRDDRPNSETVNRSEKSCDQSRLPLSPNTRIRRPLLTPAATWLAHKDPMAPLESRRRTKLLSSRRRPAQPCATPQRQI